MQKDSLVKSKNYKQTDGIAVFIGIGLLYTFLTINLLEFCTFMHTNIYSEWIHGTNQLHTLVNRLQLHNLKADGEFSLSDETGLGLLHGIVTDPDSMQQSASLSIHFALF